MKKEYVQSFERACEITGDDATKLPDVSWMPENQGKANIATYKMEIIEKAQNMLDNFVANYGNSRQWKYYPWLIWNASVGAFVFHCTAYTYTYTFLGSRFCFVDAKTAEFMGKTHIGLYNDMMLKS